MTLTFHPIGLKIFIINIYLSTIHNLATTMYLHSQGKSSNTAKGRSGILFNSLIDNILLQSTGSSKN